MIAFAATRSAHSLLGELVAAAALPGAAAPVAVASGASWTVAIGMWCAWSIGFAASVVAVHRVLSARRNSSGGRHIAVLAAIALATAIIPTLRAALPLVATSVVVAIWSPSPRRLRAIGVALVIASVASGVLVQLAR